MSWARAIICVRAMSEERQWVQRCHGPFSVLCWGPTALIWAREWEGKPCWHLSLSMTNTAREAGRTKGQNGNNTPEGRKGRVKG